MGAIQDRWAENNSTKPDNSSKNLGRLPRRNGEDTPSYLIGGTGDGLGTVSVEEIEEGQRTGCWTVVYEFVAEGEEEPVTSILGTDEKPEKILDSYTLDLPGNVYQTQEQAINYAEALLEDSSFEEIFQEYGLEPAPNREPKLVD